MAAASAAASSGWKSFIVLVPDRNEQFQWRHKGRSCRVSQFFAGKIWILLHPNFCPKIFYYVKYLTQRTCAPFSWPLHWSKHRHRITIKYVIWVQINQAYIPFKQCPLPIKYHLYRLLWLRCTYFLMNVLTETANLKRKMPGVKQISEQSYPLYSEIMHSDWLFLVMWLATANQSALFQSRVGKLYFSEIW